MKKICFLMMVLIPAHVFAQKAVKPNLNKALSLWQDGKLAEAKEMIDACTTYEKTMNDGKTWYYKGLIYASLDTTSNETFHSLSPNPLNTAIESFNRAEKMITGGKEYFIQDPNDPMASINNTKSRQLEGLSTYYLDRGIKQLQQDEPNYVACMEFVEKSRQVFERGIEANNDRYANDTLAYYVLAIAAHGAEMSDTAVSVSKKYYEKGGKSKEPYLILYQIYNNSNKEKALEIVREAKRHLPGEPQFSLIEIELLIDLNRIDEAKMGLEQAVVKDPENKTLHFFLGYANTVLNNLAVAEKNFERALKIDPTYFDAQVWLAKVMTEDARKIKNQINALGISAADKKKKMELDVVYVEKLKKCLPYWEKAEKLNPSDEEVLSQLYAIYSDLGNDPQIERVQKRMKELGLE